MSENKKLLKKLLKIRAALKLAKDEWNPEYGFQFRNAEAMLAQIKPALAKENLTLSFSDDVVAVGSHNYVKTTLTIVDAETFEEFSTTAMAREDDVQTMPASPMITGAASSYARKYALQGAFAIDDGRMDPDAYGVERHETNAQAVATAPANVAASAPIAASVANAAPIADALLATAPKQAAPTPKVEALPASPAPVTAAPEPAAAPSYGQTETAPDPYYGTSGEAIPPIPGAPGDDFGAPSATTWTATPAPAPAPAPIEEATATPAPAPVEPAPAPATNAAPAANDAPWNSNAQDPAWGYPDPYAGYDGYQQDPGYDYDPYASGPVSGEAPQMPDFDSMDAATVAFPWQNEADATPAPDFDVPIPSYGDPTQTNAAPAVPAPAQTASAQAQTAPVKKANGKKKLVPLGVSFEHEFGRAKILTDAGIVYYKASDEGTLQGPWSADARSLDDVDLDALYEDAKKHTKGVSLSEYAGMVF